MSKKFEGVHVLAGTPLNDDYTLNEDAIRKEVEWCLEKGADGIWTTGYFGEGNILDESVRKRLFEVFIESVRGRVFCGAGCQGINPFQVIRLVNYAEELGYDMAWIPPMCPRKPTDDEIYDFYKMVHDNTRLPLGIYSTLAYNVYIRPSVTARIADLERVACMKEVISDFDHIAQLSKLGVYKKIKVFPVYAEVLHLMLGAAGCLCNPSWLPQAVEMYKAFKNGDIKRALQINIDAYGMLPAFPATAQLAFGAKIEHSIEGVNKAFNSVVMGIDLGPPMAPYKPATEEQIEKIRARVSQGGVPSLL